MPENFHEISKQLAVNFARELPINFMATSASMAGEFRKLRDNLGLKINPDESAMLGTVAFAEDESTNDESSLIPLPLLGSPGLRGHGAMVKHMGEKYGLTILGHWCLFILENRSVTPPTNYVALSLSYLPSSSRSRITQKNMLDSFQQLSVLIPDVAFAHEGQPTSVIKLGKIVATESIG